MTKPNPNQQKQRAIELERVFNTLGRAWLADEVFVFLLDRPDMQQAVTCFVDEWLKLLVKQVYSDPRNEASMRFAKELNNQQYPEQRPVVQTAERIVVPKVYAENADPGRMDKAMTLIMALFNDEHPGEFAKTMFDQLTHNTLQQCFVRFAHRWLTLMADVKANAENKRAVELGKVVVKMGDFYFPMI